MQKALDVCKKKLLLVINKYIITDCEVQGAVLAGNWSLLYTGCVKLVNIQIQIAVFLITGI